MLFRAIVCGVLVGAAFVGRRRLQNRSCRANVRSFPIVVELEVDDTVDHIGRIHLGIATDDQVAVWVAQCGSVASAQLHDVFQIPTRKIASNIQPNRTTVVTSSDAPLDDSWNVHLLTEFRFHVTTLVPPSPAVSIRKMPNPLSKGRHRPFFAVLCLFMAFFDGQCLTLVDVSTCDDLVVYLQSCSKSLSLQIIQDINCTSMSVTMEEPISMLEPCTIHGMEDKRKKVPTIDWGTHKNLISVGEGAILTLENLHLKFSNPRAVGEGAAIPPAIVLEARSQLLMNLVAVSFDVCTDGGTETSSKSSEVDLLSLWLSRASGGGEGSFYFTEQMEIDHSNGSSSSLCDVGVHCGVPGDDPSMVGPFVESVTGGAVSRTCLSMVDAPSSDFPVSRTFGIMVLSVLCITAVVLLILLYWVRSHRKSRAAKVESEMCSPATTRQFLTPTGSMRSLVTRDEIRDSPINILHEFHQPKPQATVVSTPPPLFDPTVHVNPLFLQPAPGDFRSAPQLGKLTQVGTPEKQKNPLWCGSFDAQLLDKRLFETTEQISAALFRCGVVTEGPPILEAECSGIFQKGVYKGNAVAIKIREHLEDGGGWGSGRGLLQQSDLDHYNLVKVFFAMHGDVFNGELTARHPITAYNENDSSPATEGSAQRSVIVTEYCDKGTAEEAIGEMVYFHSGPWGMPRISWILMTGIDVAEAMAYLHAHRIIHGDLTSKNIALKSDANDPRGLVCKVGNLHGGAMSVALCTEPAEFRRGQATDMYSFGMFMLELILGNGMDPLASKSVDGSDVSKPHIPVNIPPFYGELLQGCWDASIDRRPTFQQISSSLKGVLMQYYLETPASPVSNSYDSDKESGSESISDQEGSLSIRNSDIVIPTHAKENPMDKMEEE